MPPFSIETQSENLYLREQLEATQKAMQDFVYAVSHDLGAPLRAVTSFSSILQQKYSNRMDEKSRTYLNFVAEGGSKAQNMLNGLLLYSRLHTQTMPFAPTDLNDVLRQVEDELWGKMRNHDANIVNEALPTVLGDREQIRQLIFAIVDNALTYGRPRMPVAISIAAEEANDMWCVSVSDDGIGIPEDCRERVFQIFKRLHPDEAYPGIGMGLPMARRIVQRHGGAIGVTQAAHGGTICWFTLPKVAAPPRSSEG